MALLVYSSSGQGAQSGRSNATRLAASTPAVLTEPTRYVTIPPATLEVVRSATVPTSVTVPATPTPAHTEAADPVQTVWNFYADLNAKDLEAAWELLSPNYRATLDFNSWVDGYPATQSVHVTSAEVAAQEGTHATVQIEIAADGNADAGVRTIDFAGTWGVVLADGTWKPPFPGGVGQSSSYDGGLLTGKSWSRPTSGSVGRTYDSNFRTSGLSVNGASISSGYAADSLLTSAGSESPTYTSQSGQLNSTTLGVVSDQWTYDSFGEPTAYTATANASPPYSVQYARDNLGRITSKSKRLAASPAPRPTPTGPRLGCSPPPPAPARRRMPMTRTATASPPQVRAARSWAPTMCRTDC